MDQRRESLGELGTGGDGASPGTGPSPIAAPRRRARPTAARHEDSRTDLQRYQLSPASTGVTTKTTDVYRRAPGPPSRRLGLGTTTSPGQGGRAFAPARPVTTPAPPAPNVRRSCKHDPHEAGRTDRQRPASAGLPVRRGVGVVKFRVERDVLAEAVAWAARTLPTRPSVPVLAGLLVEAADSGLTLSSFDYEVSGQVAVAGRRRRSRAARWCPAGCSPTSPARLPAATGRDLDRRRQVRARRAAARVHAAHAARSTTTPTLPEMPSGTRHHRRVAVLATAVAQVAIAAGRDDTLPDAHRRSASRSRATRSPWPPPTATGSPCASCVDAGAAPG